MDVLAGGDPPEILAVPFAYVGENARFRRHVKAHAEGLGSNQALDQPLLEEEDTCMSYEEEDTCMPYGEEDTCMSYEEKDTCMSYEEEEAYLKEDLNNFLQNG